MTTYRYFLEPSVCWCRATENPKKLPLVFPSLITGNRSSMLNPLQVCVPWYTARTAQSNSLGDIVKGCFPQIHDQRGSGTGSLPHWFPTGRLLLLLLHRDLPIDSRLFPPSHSRVLLPRCWCLPPSPALPSLPSSLPLHTHLKQVHSEQSQTVERW